MSAGSSPAAGEPAPAAAPPAPEARAAPPPEVSVILAVRDGAAHVGAAIAAVLAGDHPPDRLEVVVAVAPSADDTARAVAAAAARAGRRADGRPRVRALPNPRGTASSGLNAALAAARGAVVVRLDAHARPAPDYVRACVHALATTGATAVGGPMVTRGETAFGEAVAAAHRTWLGSGGAAYRQAGRAGPVDTVYLGAWRRAELLRLGGFDEGLARNQDAELCARIRAAGGTVWLDPAIRTRTAARATPGALAAQYLGYGAGRAATLRRHPRSLGLRQALPALWGLLVLAALVAAALGPSGRRALGALGALYGAALALTAAVAAPRAPARAGRIAAALAIMHAAWALGFWSGMARALGRRR